LIEIDWIAGLIVGVVMLVSHPWLATLYALPAMVLVGMGLANLGYACFSFTLARSRRGEWVPLFRVLAAANLLWALVCLTLAGLWFREATALGLAALVIEALLVGGLGVLEWRASGVGQAE
jgi:hypothetical protein